MIRLGIVGARPAGKTTVANILELPEVEVVDNPSVETLREDAYLLVCDKDLIDEDYALLKRIAQAHRAVGVALNKSDTFRAAQVRQLLQLLKVRLDRIVPSDHIVACAVSPVQIVWRIARDGSTSEHHRSLPPQIADLHRLAHELTIQAENSLRVRSRTLANQIALAFRSK